MALPGAIRPYVADSQPTSLLGDSRPAFEGGRPTVRCFERARPGDSQPAFEGGRLTLLQARAHTFGAEEVDDVEMLAGESCLGPRRVLRMLSGRGG